jgi:MFS family permease
LKGTFRSLQSLNYRIWSAGALVSNIGSWMQRTAQDWIVLTELTHRSATSVGIVMGLQFGPQLLLLPLSGFAADHLDRRKVLFCTQAAMGLLALGLGLLVVTGVVRLWHVYVFAFLLGCASAFDSPARQTFVAELVGELDLPNAVALNSTSFNAARMIGPAIAGGLIAGVGSGWVFLINALTFLAMLCSLSFLRIDPPKSGRRPIATRGGLVEGFRYVWQRPDLQVILLMLFLVGTFGLNFAIFISTMSVTVFHAGAGQFGLLTSMMAAGSVTGALMAAARAKPTIPVLAAGAATFGVACALAAMMPSYALFGLALVRGGRRRPDADDIDQQPCANFDRARHARPHHRDIAGDHVGRNPDRRADRGLGCRHLWPAVGALCRSRGRPARRGRRADLSHETSPARR